MASSSSDTQEWYLEVEGRRIGPFQGQQIRDLYKDGEVLARHKVISLDGSTVQTVEEFAAQPQKPALRPGDDPEVRLFDALQAARERKHAQTPEQAASSASRLGFDLERDSRQKWWMGALLTVICGLAVWGLVSVFRSGGSGGTAPAKNGADTERVNSVRTQPETPPGTTSQAPPPAPVSRLAPRIPPPPPPPPPTGGGAVRLEHSYRGSSDAGADHGHPVERPKGGESRDSRDSRDGRDSRDDRHEDRDSRESEPGSPGAQDAPSAQDPAVADPLLPSPVSNDPETVAD